MKDSLRLIYMAGGADYTITPLIEILKSKHKLVHVYTKQPKPSGRGKKLNPSKLQTFLDEKNISHSMPVNLKSDKEIEKVKSLKPDLILVFSYGHILPQAILDIPEKGCLNIHASLLPKWRGATPVQYSLLNNEKKTGFSIMIMTTKVDEGNILYSESLRVDENDNTLSLLKKITNLASKSILNIINKYVEGSIKGIEQDHKSASYTQIIRKKETYIDFKEDAEIILGKIRAYNPNPGAKCFIRGELIKIIEAKKELLDNNKNKPGTILDDKLLISCGNNAIRPTVIQRSGKKPLKLDQVLNGWKITPGMLAKKVK